MTKPIKHAAAGAFIFTREHPVKTLLVHHKKSNTWLQPGGHCEPWENPLEATIREVKEETGLDISAHLASPKKLDPQVHQLPLPAYILQERIDPRMPGEPVHYHIDHLYIVRIPEQTVSHRAEESHDIGWFTTAQLKTLSLFENMRSILNQEMNQ